MTPPNPLSREAMDRLEALLAKATDRPWQVSGCRLRIASLRDARNDYHTIGPDGDGLAAVFYDPKTGQGFVDAHLIVEAVNSLPSLLAALKDAREALEPFATIPVKAEADDDKPVLDWMGSGEPDSLVYRWTVGDFRRATRIYEALTPPKGSPNV